MSKKEPGILVSFEGTEGSGKSTLMKRVYQLAQEASYRVIQTREPGGSTLAEKIRSILLETTMNPWTEVLLYEAARAEHTNLCIKPALERGDIILCDRFTDSTLAYQAHARGLPWKDIKTLNKMATFGIRPHLTVFLDMDPKMSLSRAQNPNRFEAEGLEFHKRVRLGFIKARSENPKRWLTLRNQKSTPEENAAVVLKHLIQRFKNRLKLNG